MYKHDAIIRAWLDGKPIQAYTDDKWVDLTSVNEASHVPTFRKYVEYRIKPKPMIKKYKIIAKHKKDGDLQMTGQYYKDQQDWETKGNSRNFMFICIVPQTETDVEADDYE